MIYVTGIREMVKKRRLSSLRYENPCGILPE